MSEYDYFISDPDKFISSIYGKPGGTIRLRLLLEDLSELIEKNNIHNILDIGCGNGFVTLELLKKFRALNAHLVDPSEKMLEKAKLLAKELKIDKKRVVYELADLDQIYKTINSITFDLVICHTVVNWVDTPYGFIEKLVKISKTNNSFVSFLAGSYHGSLIGYAKSGDKNKLNSLLNSPEKRIPSDNNLTSKGFCVVNADVVLKIIKKHNCKIYMKSGIRVLFDLYPTELSSNPKNFAALKKIEDKIRKEEDFWKFGNMIHIIFKG